MTISQLSAFRISSLDAQAEAHFWGPALKAPVPQQSHCQTVTHVMNQNVCFSLCGGRYVCLCLHMFVCVWSRLRMNVCVFMDVSQSQSVRWGFWLLTSMAGPPGLKPQKLFNFQNFARGKKYNLPPQKLFSISHHLKGQIMHPINAVHFFLCKV